MPRRECCNFAARHARPATSALAKIKPGIRRLNHMAQFFGESL